MASQLNATAVPIVTPSLLNFDNLVKIHGYEPWFNPDGTIADRYSNELIQLADPRLCERDAYPTLSALGFLHQEIVQGWRCVRGWPGGLTGFTPNHIRSVAHALKNHPVSDEHFNWQ